VAQPEDLNLYRILSAIAGADGAMAHQETALLEKYRAKLGITPEEARQAEEERRKGGLPFTMPPKLGDRIALFKRGAEMAYADGVLTPEESRALEALRAKLEIPPEMTPDLLRPYAQGTTVVKRPAPESAPAPAPVAVPIYEPPSRADSPNRAPLFLGLGVVALVVIGGIWWIISSIAARSKKAPFDPYVEEYLRPPEVPDWIANAEADAQDPDYVAPDPPTVAGKLVIVNRDKKEIDDLFVDLPDGLRAENPEEVGTVVWVSFARVAVGTYTDGATGYAHSCTVHVIDKAGWTVTAIRRFQGSAPPSFKKHSGDAEGSKPDSAVIEYLKNLPRK
jgi:hypothetical protein